ncbi:glycoside hydrolase family 88 protein [Chryseobacterium hagamense]|uniref:Glucuronyl hydrolase n=1 Tax=Chryseobacterium hagamense TaxID=395935 RepID=A0A511YPV3_9FLAO|nr:glycoside hydrolase family 88 protein [Chryseobacterium hagamense]GEN77232.1 glucuronyl hydrolase [Chryseobacterium hagamense]
MKQLPIRNIRIFTLSVLLLSIISCKTKSSASAGQQWAASALETAGQQYRFLAKETPPDRFPKTFEKGKLITSSSDWWCSGFYPGTLLYLYKASGDPFFLKEAEKKLTVLEKEKNNKTTHDLGFMMFCSFGNAYKITSLPQYQEVINTSSHSLISRFNPVTGTIRSWDAAPWNSQWKYPVIIDNMMNLEMLLWAADHFRNPEFKAVALKHAETTLKNHFRPDFSSYHVVSYDPETGKVEKKNTDQGYADGSAWARGQSWGLYGYTVMYRFTKKPEFLKQAQGIADFILNHPNLPADKIPYWDFNDPSVPNAKRDASAGAVIASALLELKTYVPKLKSRTYAQAAETMLKTLSSPEYLARNGENGGFILRHSVGNMPDKTEVDVPLSYADYYYVEALLRYLGKSSY